MVEKTVVARVAATASSSAPVEVASSDKLMELALVARMDNCMAASWAASWDDV